MRTFSPKSSDIVREWHTIDADGLVLGRLATEVATLLRGKHKPIFAPHVDTGDHVIVVNAAKVVLTSGKAERTRSPTATAATRAGSRRRRSPACSRPSPEEVVRRAVAGMLPKGTLGRQMLTKLKVYAGPDHPHAAQTPKPRLVERARSAS